MADARWETSEGSTGLPFGVWWAIGEAVAVALTLPVLRLLGAL